MQAIPAVGRLGIFLAVAVLVVRFNGPIPAQETTSDSKLFGELVETGVTLESTPVRLAMPRLSESQSAGDRQAGLATLVGDETWERFARNSPVAPITLSIQAVESISGQRIGYEISSAFALHVSMDQLRDQRLMERLFGKPSAEDGDGDLRFEAIGEAELEEIGIAIVPDREAYSRIQISLLNKIRLQGVIRVERAESSKQLDVAWLFDDRPAAKHPEWKNTWFRLGKNELGESVVGPAQPYAGSGGYIRLVQIDLPESLVVVEMRWVIHEPTSWFDGGNLLRSKLPLLIQESVRSFRRKLAAK